jgi:pimeloyl-ACP methyl ester carboxylesterase
MRSSTNRARPLVGWALVASVVTGCSSQADSGARHVPTFQSAQCPDDVEVLVVPAHQCGYVTSLRASGLRVRVFVVAVDPPDPPHRAPILETGTDLGTTPGYGGLAPIAQRTGRRTVIVDLPGTGHSEPSLACHEAQQAGDAGLLDAIRSCRARVERAGVDPREMTPDAVAQDLYAVMTAFGSPTWVLQGHGTTGEAAVQVARDHPGQVEALVLDSPFQADTHPAQRVSGIVGGVAEQCAHDPGCHRQYGSIGELWNQARHSVARTPLMVGQASIDRSGLGNVVRWLVAPVSEGPAELPVLLSEVAARKPGALLSSYARDVGGSPPMCVGHLPKCESGTQVFLGAVLSSLCPTSANEPEWRTPCRAWGVQEKTSAPEPIRDVPALVFYGRYDPFAAPSDVRRMLARELPEAYVVEDLTAGHNVLGRDCIRSIRNDWVAGDHQAPPPVPDCLTSDIAFP